MSKGFDITLLEEIPDEVTNWLDRCLDDLLNHNYDEELVINRIVMLISMMPRELKAIAPIEPDLGQGTNINLVDLCRLYLLIQLRERDNNAIPVLKSVIRYCDDEEKASVMKGVSEFDREGDLLEEVIDLCRTNSTLLFASIALNNRYPADHFPEHNLNQLVLKALFSQLNIELIVNLKQRLNSELTRMALDYRDERVAAGRDVPESLDLAVEGSSLTHELS